MTRYRYTIGRRRGRWRETEREARMDAVRAGFGSVDDYAAPGMEPVIYLEPLVRVERSE